ncbi:MAG TPA: hypothetical protein VFG68_21695, partial [Fimbriiglobus sp.]|nr:hypothetical protein [Fimbriiglobus sp.]
SLADLSNPTVRERLERRDEIQLRRQAFRGLATLFKRAFADRGPRGGGYWFAPHWWFITSLDREDPHRGKSDGPTPPRPVGPPFPRVFGPRAVIGAGSVVTRDVPGGVFAAGNPCRVVREITG